MSGVELQVIEAKCRECGELVPLELSGRLSVEEMLARLEAELTNSKHMCPPREAANG